MCPVIGCCVWSLIMDASSPGNTPRVTHYIDSSPPSTRSAPCMLKRFSLRLSLYPHRLPCIITSNKHLFKCCLVILNRKGKPLDDRDQVTAVQTHAPLFLLWCISLFVLGIFAEHAGCWLVATPCFTATVQSYREAEDTNSTPKKEKGEKCLRPCSQALQQQFLPKQGYPEKLISKSSY